ncbi:MAG: cupredoxin domain-containing protein [Patescibacteria group bacterium]
MSKTTKLIVTFVVVAAVAAGIVFAAGKDTPDETKKSTSGNNQAAPTTITFDGNGFSPAEVTVKSGGAIKIVNQSEAEIEPSSDPHPTHTINSELNAGDIEPGENKTFTVTKKGTWGYHNHYSASQRGSIIVE